MSLVEAVANVVVGYGVAVHELMEARDERRLLRLQKQLAGHKLLIIDDSASCDSPRPAPNSSSS